MTQSTGEQFPPQWGSPVGPAYLQEELGLILGGEVGNAKPVGKSGEGGTSSVTQSLPSTHMYIYIYIQVQVLFCLSLGLG